MDFDWDCIVVGAGPAGLSAALTLGRARRRVLVLDSGAPRNFAARAMHGVLGHDGLAPAALRARGVDELDRYEIEVRAAEVDPERARAIDGGVELEGETARTLILATGLLDETPAIEGFEALYGVSAHTCPYCDGWEHRDERIAVLAPVQRGAHLGRLLRQWSGDVVVVTGGGPSVDADEEAELAEIGVAVVREPIERFVARDGRLTAIELTGRPPLSRDALFFHIGFRPRTALAAAIGCALGEGGFVIAAEEDRQTSADRVYAAGNCVDPMQTVPLATADGARAALAVNVRLVEEGVLQSRAGPADPSAALLTNRQRDGVDERTGGDPKSVVQRLIAEVLNEGRLEVIDELYTPQMARGARRWIVPFRESFPDVQMQIVDLIAEGDKVVGRFHCSATNLGPWRGQPPTGRRFERVDEVYIFRVSDGRISEAWGIEDTGSRERQLGLSR